MEIAVGLEHGLRLPFEQQRELLETGHRVLLEGHLLALVGAVAEGSPAERPPFSAGEGG